ncbi:MAG: ATP-dependent helicase IRC3 [Myxococcota bacterium]
MTVAKPTRTMFGVAEAPTLRPYQREAVAAVIAARRQGVRRMVVCLPTGSGKTVIFAELSRMARKNVLVLAHRAELLEQAQMRLQAAIGTQRIVAIEQADREAPANASVVVCSIRSLRTERLQRVIRGRDIGLVLYDECHHATADDNMRVLRELGCFDSDWTGTLLGFTATTARGDGQGLDKVFEEIVYHRSIQQLMKEGWLAPLRGFRIATTADLGGLSSGGLDFREDELAEAVDIEDRNALVARSIQELARDRRTVAFCVTVNHARNLTKALNRLGVPADLVHGEMKRDRREQALRDFREGRTRVLSNVGVLTEGFDDPGVSAIAMARPTRSEGLYAQCVGRGTRLAEGKKDCLILDFVDLSDLSLVGLPSLFGMPRQVNLDGEDAAKAAEVWQQMMLDLPGFELEAGAITLDEIQKRAALFDPLTLEADPEVRAISPLDWHSLGRMGLVLHVLDQRSRVKTITILAKAARGKRWHVFIDGDRKERFSHVEQAVEAVDYEVGRMGRGTYASAHPAAHWRHEPASADLVEQLPRKPRGRLRVIDAWRTLAHADAYRPASGST